MTCKICSGTTLPYIQNIFDDRYGYPEIFNIEKCSSCQSFITEPPMAMDKIEALYTNFYPRKNISTAGVKERFNRWEKTQKNFSSNNTLQSWLSGEHRVHRSLPKAPRAGIRILDIGCGDGSSLLELQSLGYEAFGIETDNNLEKIKTELGLNIFIGTVEDAPFASYSFDVVIANQVLEHVVNLDTFMRGVQKFLAPGGTLIMSTPSADSMFRKIYGRHWVHWHIPYHQQVFSKKAAIILHKKYGFTVQNIQTVSPSSWTVHEINRLRFDAKPGVKNPFWTSGSDAEGAVQIHSSIISKILRRLFFIFMSGLGKIADLFGYGNCLITYATYKSS